MASLTGQLILSCYNQDNYPNASPLRPYASPLHNGMNRVGAKHPGRYLIALNQQPITGMATPLVLFNPAEGEAFR